MMQYNALMQLLFDSVSKNLFVQEMLQRHQRTFSFDTQFLGICKFKFMEDGGDIYADFSFSTAPNEIHEMSSVDSRKADFSPFIGMIYRIWSSPYYKLFEFNIPDIAEDVFDNQTFLIQDLRSFFYGSMPDESAARNIIADSGKKVLKFINTPKWADFYPYIPVQEMFRDIAAITKAFFDTVSNDVKSLPEFDSVYLNYKQMIRAVIPFNEKWASGDDVDWEYLYNAICPDGYR